MNRIEPKRIFIDTSGWIEYALEGEKYHQQVKSYLYKELGRGSKLFTSDYVLDETWTRMLMQQGFRDVKTLKEHIDAGVDEGELLVLWVDETVFERAWQYFEKFSEHQLSFTDCTIIALVDNLNIDEVLTLDSGFAKVGLNIQPDL